MSAAAIIEYENTSGLTLTLDLYPLGALNTVTAALSGLALTEDTSRKGLYQGTTNPANPALVGIYQAWIHIGVAMIPVGFVTMSDDTSIHRIVDFQGAETISANVSSIAAAMAAGGVVSYVLSPMITNSIVQVIIGGSYMNSENQALTWLGKGLWPDLTGASITLFVYDQDNGNLQLLTKAGVVQVATGAGQEVRVQLSAANTLLFNPGRYSFGVRATLFNGDPVFLALGVSTFIVLEGMGVTTTTSTTTTTTSTTTTTAGP